MTELMTGLIALLAFAACGKAPSGADHPALTRSSAEAWSQVKSLAESIQDESLRYDPNIERLSLTFEYLNFDVTSAGSPPGHDKVTLVGKLGIDGTSELSSAKTPGFTARAKCEDSRCLTAEIELVKRTGALAGTAIIRHETTQDSVILIETGALDTPAQKDIYDSLSGRDVKNSYMMIKQIEGTPRIRFETMTTIENKTRPESDPDYFNAKSFNVKGTVGDNVDVTVTFAKNVHGSITSSSETYRADVKFARKISAVRLEFHKDPSRPNALSSFSVGRKHFGP